jgi:hypothetical protein
MSFAWGFGFGLGAVTAWFLLIWLVLRGDR